MLTEFHTFWKDKNGSNGNGWAEFTITVWTTASKRPECGENNQVEETLLQCFHG